MTICRQIVWLKSEQEILVKKKLDEFLRKNCDEFKSTHGYDKHCSTIVITTC